MADVSGVSGTSSSAISSAVNKSLGKDDFLKLLITQLKYQDPMEPTDNKEFVSQMAQFSSLEQMNNIADGFTNLGALNESSLREATIAQAISLIGRSVTAEMSDGTVTGEVTGMKLIDGVPNVVIDGNNVPISNISEVKTTSSTTETTEGGDTSGE